MYVTGSDAWSSQNDVLDRIGPPKRPVRSYGRVYPTRPEAARNALFWAGNAHFWPIGPQAFAITRFRAYL